jgi:peptidoglycan/xylan/chitin deacetylase (PgdA/CDA1 family)
MPFVLCYHAVSDDWDDPLAVRRDTLERQVAAAIRWGWRPASLGDVVADKARALHVTFDDGFRSVLGALPMLQRLDVRPTIFVCTGYAAGGRVLDVPALKAVAASHPHELATLSWEELREAVERGAEVGSHTRLHPDLRELSDGELRQEVAVSREEIESELGRRCRYLAFPYGQFDRRVQHAVERAGYDGAFGLVGVGRRGGRFGIARVEASRRNGPALIALKSSPAWPLLDPPLRRLRSVLARLR